MFCSCFVFRCFGVFVMNFLGLETSNVWWNMKFVDVCFLCLFVVFFGLEGINFQLVN